VDDLKNLNQYSLIDLLLFYVVAESLKVDLCMSCCYTSTMALIPGKYRFHKSYCDNLYYCIIIAKVSCECCMEDCCCCY